MIKPHHFRTTWLVVVAQSIAIIAATSIAPPFCMAAPEHDANGLTDWNRPYSLDQHVDNLGEPNSVLHIRAEEAIRASTQAAIPSLLRGLSSASPIVRRKSLTLLQEIGPTVARASIIEISQTDSNVSMRSMGIGTLPCLNDRSLSAIAKAQARPSEHVAVRRAAIMAAAKIDGASSVGWLKERLADRPGVVAIRAALELAVLGSTAGYSLAIQGLSDSDRQTRIESARVLFRLGLRESLGALRIASEDLSTGIGSRGEALQALKHIELQDVPASERSAVLKEYLNSNTPALREWAAFELAKIASSEAKKILKDAATENGHPGQSEAIDGFNSFSREPGPGCQ